MSAYFLYDLAMLGILLIFVSIVVGAIFGSGKGAVWGLLFGMAGAALLQFATNRWFLHVIGKGSGDMALDFIERHPDLVAKAYPGLSLTQRRDRIARIVTEMIDRLSSVPALATGMDHMGALGVTYAVADEQPANGERALANELAAEVAFGWSRPSRGY